MVGSIFGRDCLSHTLYNFFFLPVEEPRLLLFEGLHNDKQEAGHRCWSETKDGEGVDCTVLKYNSRTL